MSLNFVAVSIYEMLRSGAIIFQYLLSICIVGMIPKRYQTVGTVICLLGLNIVGLGPILLGEKKSDSTHSTVHI